MYLFLEEVEEKDPKTERKTCHRRHTVCLLELLFAEIDRKLKKGADYSPRLFQLHNVRLAIEKDHFVFNKWLQLLAVTPNERLYIHTYIVIRSVLS